MQSLSKLDIINTALDAVGQKRISSLSENNERAKLPPLYYDSMRRELLRSCAWTFAKREVTLNLIGNTDNTTGDLDSDSDDQSNNITANNTVQPYVYMYQYPKDAFYIVKLYTNVLNAAFDYNALDPEDNWWNDRRDFYDNVSFEIIRTPSTNEIGIATNLQNALCRYIQDITDESQFDPLFASALGLKVAQKICLPLTGDREAKAQIDHDLEVVMTDAFRLNLTENPERGPARSSFEKQRGSW